jgi:hypothetical protein
MTPVFKKLNFKAESAILVVNAPVSFLPEMEAMSAFTEVQVDWPSKTKTGFILGFCQQKVQVDELARLASDYLEGDGLLWIAYPKGTSKKYKCEFNRDNGWAELGKLGFEPVRMVAIDEDWSALRFRRVEFIKKMTRSFAMTEEGKNKTGKPE